MKSVANEHEPVRHAARLGAVRHGGVNCVDRHGTSPCPTVIASEAKQSRYRKQELDCFVASLLAMTTSLSRRADPWWKALRRRRADRSPRPCAVPAPDP